MSEVAFTRNNDYQDTHLSRAQAPGWAIEVWRDKRKQPISFYRHADNYSMTMALDLDSATARAIAAELLHAADVALLADTNNTAER